MFARVGPEIRGWPDVIGTLQDGRSINVMEDGAPIEPGTHRPANAAAAFYRGTRWLVYLTSLRNPGMRPERDLFASVVARDWQRSHPQMPFARLRILFVPQAPPGGNQSTAHTEVRYDGPGQSAGSPESPWRNKPDAEWCHSAPTSHPAGGSPPRRGARPLGAVPGSGPFPDQRAVGESRLRQESTTSRTTRR